MTIQLAMLINERHGVYISPISNQLSVTFEWKLAGTSCVYTSHSFGTNTVWIQSGAVLEKRDKDCKGTQIGNISCVSAG